MRKFFLLALTLVVSLTASSCFVGWYDDDDSSSCGCNDSHDACVIDCSDEVCVAGCDESRDECYQRC